MIIDAGRASRLSLTVEDGSAQCGRAEASRSTPTRATLELSRGLGGMTMRALVGAEFRPGPDFTRFELLTLPASFDSGVAATCASVLGTPLIPGLPNDFAPAVLAGLGEGSVSDPLPAGTLRIDRAAYDLMGSSEAAFFQAASLLRSALSAMALGHDVKVRLTSRLNNMPTEWAG